MRALFLTEPLPVLQKPDHDICKGKQGRPPDPTHTTGQLVDPVMGPLPTQGQKLCKWLEEVKCPPYDLTWPGTCAPR